MNVIVLAGQINAAIAAHERFMTDVEQAVACGEWEVEPEDIAKDYLCPFGTWLHGSVLSDDVRRSASYREAKRLHAAFHRSCRDVATFIRKGQRQRAKQVLADECDEASRALHQALADWRSSLNTSVGRVKGRAT